MNGKTILLYGMSIFSLAMSGLALLCSIFLVATQVTSTVDYRMEHVEQRLEETEKKVSAGMELAQETGQLATHLDQETEEALRAVNETILDSKRDREAKLLKLETEVDQRMRELETRLKLIESRSGEP